MLFHTVTVVIDEVRTFLDFSHSLQAVLPYVVVSKNDALLHESRGLKGPQLAILDLLAGTGRTTRLRG